MRYTAAILACLLLVGCVGPFRAPDVTRDITADDVSKRLKNVEDAEAFVKNIGDQIRITYGFADAICDTQGPAAPSWCVEAEAAKPILREIEKAVLSGLHEWRIAGESDAARDQFVILFLRQYRRFLDIKAKVDAFGIE